MTLDSLALACHRDEPRRFSRRPPWRCLRAAAFGVGVAAVAAHPLFAQERASARDLGIVVGVLAPGPLNAITDVVGVRVGHVTISRGDSINTGVTAILPHGANIFREKVRRLPWLAMGSENWPGLRRYRNWANSSRRWCSLVRCVSLGSLMP